MNNLYGVAFTAFFIVFTNLTFAYGEGSVPPDTTSNIVEKSQAIYLIDEGRAFYNEGKIKDALTKFREAAIKDPNNWKAVYWVGKCHFRLNNYGYAAKYAQNALDLGGDKVDNEVYFNLAIAYHNLGVLDTALINYKKAIELMPKNRLKVLQVEKNAEKASYAQKLMVNEPTVIRENIKGYVNSGFDEYGVVIADTGKTLYFTSRRNNTMGGGINPDDQLYFEDIYRASLDPGTEEWDDVTNQLGKLNSDGFEAMNYISADGSYGIVTLNTTALEDPGTETRGSDLCEIKLNNKGDFNKPKPINNKTINTSFFEGAATVTADGNTMYFVSDRKGAKSSTDIYVVHKVGKKWGEAEPLPFTINTEGRETTPYITPDGRYLFFSSDGHEGMGGLDIYVVENKGGEWGTPVNLGYGINTVNNDTHFVYDAENKIGYISGIEIVGNKASMNIFEMDLTNFEIPQPKEEDKKTEEKK